MNDRPRIRIVVGKVGLDGHDRGSRVVARSLRDAGFEVIYTGIQNTPEMIVDAAIQEDADAIGVSIHSAAHMAIFPRILELLAQRGAGDILVTGGGIIPPEDIEALRRMGTGHLFGPGTPMRDVVAMIEKDLAERRGPATTA